MTDKFKCIAPELKDAALFYGLYSKLARKLNVSPQHIRQVALGMHTSKRVSRALNIEIIRLRGKIQERTA